jgi:hypothetical protein
MAAATRDMVTKTLITASVVLERFKFPPQEQHG